MIRTGGLGLAFQSQCQKGNGTGSSQEKSVFSGAISAENKP